MKVLLVVRWPVGGIRTFINYVYKDFSVEDELHFVVPDVNEVHALQAQLAHLKCVWHVMEEVDPSFKNFLTFSNRIIGRNNFDVIHAHGFTSALTVGWRLPFGRAKSIFTSHDVLHAKQFTGVFGWLKRIIMAILLNRFSVIHSVSSDAQENLQSHLPLINDSKCRVILNGVDTERFFNASAFDLRNSLSLGSEKIIIGFFGRFMSQKGFKYLVQALAELEAKDKGRYCVVCFGSGGFIREEKAELERKELLHLFYFHDFVSDTAPYVKGCSLVVVPSLWEACPLLPMEVLSAGIPLVATSCIGLREVCADTPAIMVPQEQSSALASAIEQVGKQDNMCFKEYATKAKVRFSVDRARAEIKQLYTTLVYPKA